MSDNPNAASIDHLRNPGWFVQQALLAAHTPKTPTSQDDENAKTTYDVDICRSAYGDMNSDGLAREVVGVGLLTRKVNPGFWSATRTDVKPFFFTISDSGKVILSSLAGTPIADAPFEKFYTVSSYDDSPGEYLSEGGMSCYTFPSALTVANLVRQEPTDVAEVWGSLSYYKKDETGKVRHFTEGYQRRADTLEVLERTVRKEAVGDLDVR